MEVIEESQVHEITPELISKMKRDELEFMLRVMSRSGSLNSYFRWEEGLVHKLGVVNYKNETNPRVPVVRSEGIMTFTECVFDSFEEVHASSNFRGCTFKSFRGFHRHSSTFSKYSGNILPKTLWDLEYEGKFNSPYLWDESTVILPSTGTKWPDVELDKRLSGNIQMRDLHSNFFKFPPSLSMIPSYEKIWLELLMELEMPLFAELYLGMIGEHQKRVGDILKMSGEDIELHVRAAEIIL
jgi:hypothetical protein